MYYWLHNKITTAACNVPDWHMLGSGNIANKKVYNTKGDHAVNANYIKKADYKTDDS